MKKYLLLLVMGLLLPVMASAHSALLAPGKMDLPENQKIMGHYDSDAISTEGVAITSKAHRYPRSLPFLSRLAVPMAR